MSLIRLAFVALVLGAPAVAAADPGQPAPLGRSRPVLTEAACLPALYPGAAAPSTAPAR